MWKDMAARADRSKALHNFTLPGGLRWANQRHLRCAKVDSVAEGLSLNAVVCNGSDSLDHQSRQRGEAAGDWRGAGVAVCSELVSVGSRKMGSTPPHESGVVLGSGDCEDDGGVSAVREKAMFDIQKAVDKIKDAVFKEGREGVACASPSPSPPLLPQPAAMPAEGEASKPWNLRTRRAACKTPPTANGYVSGLIGGALSPAGKDSRVDASRGSGISPTRAAAAAAVTDKPSRLRSGGFVAASSGEKRERAKFSVVLSKEEIEEDFFSLANRRPSRRPRKRAKYVQKQLDLLFPGLWLSELPWNPRMPYFWQLLRGCVLDSWEARKSWSLSTNVEIGEEKVFGLHILRFFMS